jgi:poly-gamma-glutamate capsule biosynthesis protein CapA/YwtB (metallophosphatase superfamily)
MLGRGIDQILPHPNRPHLYEPHMRSARDHVSLAEAKTGPLAECVSFGYVWDDALSELERMSRAAHHQPRDGRHIQRGRMTRKGHPLPHASRQLARLERRENRLLRARE